MSVGFPKVLLAVVVLLTIASSRAVGQQSLSPYTDFSSLSAGQLAGTQVRFTFVGESSGRGLPTLAFTTTASTLDLSGFLPYYRHGFGYAGDGSIAPVFSVTTSELKAMLDSVGTVAGVTDGGVDATGYVSFGLFQIIDGQPHCFESIVDQTDGAPLFTKVLHALIANSNAVAVVTRHACMLGMLQSPEVIIVDDRVQVTFPGFRRVRDTKEFVGKVRLKNTSASSLSVPLAVALEPLMEMKVLNPDGYTCHIQPGGIPFVRMPAKSPLGPGQSTELVVHLLNPNLEQVKMNFVRAFVDSGGR